LHGRPTDFKRSDAMDTSCRTEQKVGSLPSQLCSRVSKGAIAMLQEFIQSSKQFHSPPSRKVLQWSFQSRMMDGTTLEFCATIKFLHEGVPHHVTGAWSSSKKASQRDVAERALGLFVGRWAEQLLLTPPKRTSAPEHCNKDSHGGVLMQILQSFCQSFSGNCVGDSLRWNFEQDDGKGFRAFVRIPIFNSPHEFVGGYCSSKNEAQADTARRVLWYLQCPGFEDIYEPDPSTRTVASWEIAGPSNEWVSNINDNDDALQLAEKKTALMYMQNRLQREMKNILRPRQSVWEWSYESLSSSPCCPIRCRASVWLPVIDKKFVGDWANGHREAQLDVCQQVGNFLDSGGLSQYIEDEPSS